MTIVPSAMLRNFTDTERVPLPFSWTTSQPSYASDHSIPIVYW